MKRFLALYRHAKDLNRQGIKIRKPFKLAVRWWLRGDDFVLCDTNRPDGGRQVRCNLR